jgi:hypothetical protein
MSTAHCWKRRPPKQDDVKKLLPDLQLEAVVLPRTNKFPGSFFFHLGVTEILIWVIIVVI